VGHWQLFIKEEVAHAPTMPAVALFGPIFSVEIFLKNQPANKPGKAHKPFIFITFAGYSI
jgi:hypothetical protein